MRSRVSVGLVLLCLGLAGCGAMQKNKSENGGKPFKGSPSSQDPVPGPGGAATTAGVDTSLPSNVDGILAGEVLNKSSNRRLNSAYIEVVDLQTPRGNEAVLTAESDPQGYFYIRGLQKGRHYQLKAKAREDGRILAGVLVAQPPNPKLCIMLMEDPSASSDSFPGPAPLPGQAPFPSSPTSPGPTAVLEPPVRPPATIGPPENAVPRTSVAPQPPGDPSHVAAGDPNAGFQRAQPPRVEIRGPGEAENLIPPPPTFPPAPAVQTQTQPPPYSLVPGGGGSTRFPGESTPVPSCVLVGRKLENMALKTLDGTDWEYRRHRKGRLTLLDFWSTTCVPCVRAIPHLCDLQGQFGSYGLEVIGIAYEAGSFPEQAQKVRSARGRMVMNYPTLLGGGGQGPCPVKSQFQVAFLPTLILLDEQGTIVWRSGPEGLTAERLRELKQEISRHLRVQLPMGP